MMNCPNKNFKTTTINMCKFLKDNMNVVGDKSEDIKKSQGVPTVDQWVTSPTSIHEDASSILGLTLWVK